MSNFLPTAGEARRMLCANGAITLAPTPLGREQYPHPEKGMQPITVDTRVLNTTGKLFVADGPVRSALEQRLNPDATKIRDFADCCGFVKTLFSREATIWGFSGYASKGYPCFVEAEAIDFIYETLKRAQRIPEYVVDGASGAGVLGLNGLVAKDYEINTIGVSPYQGLGSMLPRDTMIVYGDTYQQREVIVGLLPDILVVIGGGEGALREAIEALRVDSAVLLIERRETEAQMAPLNARLRVKRMVAAEAKGQLACCTKLEEVPDAINTLREWLRKHRLESRWHRGDILRSYFERWDHGIAV